METRQLKPIGSVSSLTLGGGGIGQVWGETDRDEAIATTKAAIDGGITLLDMAPSYGRGEAETVIGETFGGSLPAGVRVTSKCQLGTPAIEDIHPKFERSLHRSLAAMQLETVDIFFLHSNICPDEYTYAKFSENQDRWATRWSTYVNGVIPAMERLKKQGLIRNWGITGTGVPSTIREALRWETKPSAVQLVANLMDGVGNMRLYDSEPVSPRDSMQVAQDNGIGVMGIRAVAAGSLCAAIDRDLPDDEATVIDYNIAASFRTLCDEIGEDPATIAHRYALGMDNVDTVVLGVKNRMELDDCLKAADQGPLSDELSDKIDALGIVTV
jgi:aryl-alcohol dehydrogenase-like predicted oxidoreductase